MDIYFWFTIVFSALGVIGLIFFVGYFFTSIGKNNIALRLQTAPFAVGSLEFLYTLASITKQSPLHLGEQDVTIISKNEVFFESLLADINSAQRNISILTYVWEQDETTEKVFDALQKASRRGVVVRLLIDSFGSTLSDDFVTSLREKSIQAEIFRPFAAGKISQYTARSHRRAYIFDNKIAYTGGASISKDWFVTNQDNGTSYTDIIYRCQGAAVFAIICAFHELWISVTGEVLQMSEAATASMEEGNKNPPRSNFVSLVHSPQIDIHPLTYTLWYALACAKKEIFLCTPYFVPGKRIADILIKQAQAGVAVIIVTQGTDEVWFVRDTARQYYEELLQSGVKIYEYNQLHLHTKMTILDSSVTLFGSANVDIRSQRINEENIFVIQDQKLATKNREILDGYIKHCQSMKDSGVEDWPWWRRVRAQISRSFSEQF